MTPLLCVLHLILLDKMADGALLVAKSPTTWPKRPKDASKISRFVKIESNPGRSLPSESAPSTNAPNTDHFQSQIRFLQEEHTYTIKKLHEEIERLQRKCADLIANLASEEKGFAILIFFKNFNIFFIFFLSPVTLLN